MSDETRTCKQCHRSLPLDDAHFGFGKWRGTKHYRHLCRDCYNRRGRERRAEATRTCKTCGKTYPLTGEFFGENRQQNGTIYLRYECRACMNARKRERKHGHPTPPGSIKNPPRAMPETYLVLVVDWHSDRVLMLQATVIETVANIAKLRTNDNLLHLIAEITREYPDVLLAKNPAVKMED